jgi:serine/threonine-protein kinase
MGPVGFSRTVAIKRLHPQFTADQEFVSMFLDEARLAARVTHPNVVSTLDVIESDNELMLVMDYIQGESLARLLAALRAKRMRLPYKMIGAIISGILSGLHAAHEAKNERGDWLGIVHRDMSPHNVMVGADGVVKVLDFGVAKAVGRAQNTRSGIFKGKLAYAAPEQLTDGQVDRRVDVYASSVILWEMIAGKRMFRAESDFELFDLVRSGKIEPIQHVVADMPPGLADVVARGLAREPKNRFTTAHAMAVALDHALPQASLREMADWVSSIAGETLNLRAKQLEDVETAPIPIQPTPSFAPVTESSSRAPTVVRKRSTRTFGLLFSGAAAIFVVVMLVVLWRTHFGFNTRSVAALPPDNPTESTPSAVVLRPLAKPMAPMPSEAFSAPILVPSITMPPLFAPPHITGSPPVNGVPPHPVDSALPPATSAPPATKPAVSQARPGCNPPFTLDSDGIKHAKPECL